MGGGIFIYEALSAATKMLTASKAGTRHIILFADAADSEEPGKYVQLLEKCAAAGITVSVVGLGTPGDCDANLLRDIARRGYGQCFFTANPLDIPRLFAQDTFSVARSSFVEESTSVKFTAGFASISDALPEAMLSIGGYNLCYLKTGANLAVVTVDEYKAPVVACWQAGSGRVLCYTGEADGKFTGDIANWRKAGDFFTSLARWTAGDPAKLPGNMMLLQRTSGGLCRIELHLDPERETESFTGTPRVDVLRGVAGSTPSTVELAMHSESADLMVAEIPLSGSETALATIGIPGLPPVTLTPVCLPYSPEFKPPQENKGVRTLTELASVTDGVERTDLAGIWDSLPTQPRFVEIAHWLLLLASAIFLLEILQRRTGVMAFSRFHRERLKVVDRQPKDVSKRRKQVRRRKADRTKPVSVDESDAQKKRSAKQTDETESAEKKPSHLDAMRRAKERARRRTQR